MSKFLRTSEGVVAQVFNTKASEVSHCCGDSKYRLKKSAFGSTTSFLYVLPSVTAPSAPKNNSVTAALGLVLVAFTAPVSNGGMARNVETIVTK